jgi:hypothetical protein
MGINVNLNLISYNRLPVVAAGVVVHSFIDGENDYRQKNEKKKLKLLFF